MKGRDVADLLVAECRLDADVTDEVSGDCHADEPAPNHEVASGRLHRPVESGP
jgi:hypothetical protein